MINQRRKSSEWDSAKYQLNHRQRGIPSHLRPQPVSRAAQAPHSNSGKGEVCGLTGRVSSCLNGKTFHHGWADKTPI